MILSKKIIVVFLRSASHHSFLKRSSDFFLSLSFLGHQHAIFCVKPKNSYLMRCLWFGKSFDDTIRNAERPKSFLFQILELEFIKILDKFWFVCYWFEKKNQKLDSSVASNMFDLVSPICSFLSRVTFYPPSIQIFFSITRLFPEKLK